MADDADTVPLEDLPQDVRSTLPYNHPALDAYASKIEKAYNLPPGIVNAIKNAGEKSNSDQVSSASARGVMQTIPTTQKAMGIEDPTDPLQSIAGGARYIAQQIVPKVGSDPSLIAAAYHAGPASQAARGNFDGSPITAAYAQRVSAAMPAPRQQAPNPNAVPADDLPVNVDPLAAKKAVDLAQFRKELDPTAGQSFGTNALQGAGKFFADTGSGIRQLAGNAASALGADKLGSDLQDYAGEAERRRLDQPLMNTAGGLTGYMGAGATTLALPGGALMTGARAALPTALTLSRVMSPVLANATALAAPLAATGAALSTLTPTTAPGERGENAAISALAGPVMAGGMGVIGHAIRPVVDRLAALTGSIPGVSQLLKPSWLDTMTTQQRKTVGAAMINDVPVYGKQLEQPGASIGAGRTQDQLTKLTEAINATMGEETPNTAGAFEAAKNNIGARYQAALGNQQIPLDQAYGQRIQNIAQTYMNSKKLTAPDSQLMDDMQRHLGQVAQGATLNGPEFQDALGDLLAGANRARRSSVVGGVVTNKADQQAAQAYSSMAQALEQHAAQYMPQGNLDLFNQANRQWRNLKTLEPLAPTSIDDAAAYNPTAMARRLAGTARNNWLYDQGDQSLSNLARYGDTYMNAGDVARKATMFGKLKTGLNNSWPILLGDIVGPAIAGEAISGGDHDNSSLGGTALKYAILGGLTHGALTGLNRGLNPRLTMNQLSTPRGALSELAQRLQPAPMLAATRDDSQPSP